MDVAEDLSMKACVKEDRETIQQSSKCDASVENLQDNDGVMDLSIVKHDEPESKSSDNVEETTEISTDASTGNADQGDNTQLEQEEKSQSSVEQASGSDATRTDANKDGDTTKEADHDHANPYGYIDRDEFTSEIFKLEITNLPHKLGIVQMKKKLKVLGVDNVCKLKMPNRGSYVFITFRSEAEKLDAFKKIDGALWKGKNLKVKIAPPTADPMLKKRKQIRESEHDAERKLRKIDLPGGDITNSERVNNSVTPLWKLSYPDQIQSKTKDIELYMRKLGNQLFRDNPALISNNKKLYNGYCCKLDPMVESPVEVNYRSKCEFTIATDCDNTDKVIGFRVGAYLSGNLTVVMPTDCVNVPQASIDICKSMQDYLQQKSEYASFNPVIKAGHYRTLTTRVTLDNSLMLILVFTPGSLTQEEIAAEMTRVKEHFNNPTEYPNIKSFYFEVQRETPGRDQSENVERHLLFGKEYIVEQLMGLSFRISPSAFFQINPYATHLLYELIGDWALESKQSEPILLDICCGTGTIGLTLAKRVKKVIGIEMCKEAVVDAEYNAKTNGIENAEFICGKAEAVLPSLADNLVTDGCEVIAIVDPPRSGLHNDVIRAIRRNEYIKHLVYVSCNPKAVVTNILDLTKMPSKRMKGAPFKLIRATPVDMFPQTPHCELVMLLTR